MEKEIEELKQQLEVVAAMTILTFTTSIMELPPHKQVLVSSFLKDTSVDPNVPPAIRIAAMELSSAANVEVAMTQEQAKPKTKGDADV